MLFALKVGRIAESTDEVSTTVKKTLRDTASEVKVHASERGQQVANYIEEQGAAAEGATLAAGDKAASSINEAAKKVRDQCISECVLDEGFPLHEHYMILHNAMIHVNDCIRQCRLDTFSLACQTVL